MKNIGTSRAIVVVLLAAALGHAQKPQQSTGTRAAALRDEIVAQERAELDALKSGDVAAFANCLAADAIFVDAAGPAHKEEVVKNVAGFQLRDFTMSEIRFVPLSGDSGLIVYRLTESGTSRGKDFSAKVLASAIWAKRSGKWMCLFSQETASK